MYIGKIKHSPLPDIVKWDTLWGAPATMTLQLEQRSFVDRLVLTFGEEVLLKEAEAVGYDVYRAETGKYTTTQTVTLEIAAECQSIELKITADFTDIEIKDCTVFGAIPVERPLFPTPENLEWGADTFPVANYPTVAPSALKAAAVLREKWQEETGLALKQAEKASIRFETKEMPANAYTLEITEREILLSAADERGFVIAVETLVKLLKENTLPACRIEDAPAQPFRGVHIYLPAIEQLDFAKRLIKYLISPMGYNAAIIEVAGGMQFDSHPLINEKMEEAVANGKAGIWPQFAHDAVAGGKALPKDTVRELVAYFRSFGIEVIPEIQSLGHVQFMTQAYPDIAELDEISEQLIDTRAEDNRPNKFYKHSYCPSNPRSYEILFDLMEEIIEVFQPTEYVHMGHDEVYEIGVCKVCRSKDPAQLFADDVNKIYNYLKNKGLKMMIWADMVQNRKTATRNRTTAAVDRIPKDILLLDFIWYFHPEEDIEDFLLKKDFRVAVGNLYASHYPRYNSRIAKKGMVGGQISAWVGTDVESMAQEGKLFDFRMTAQLLWSKHYDPVYSNYYYKLLLDATPALREKLECITLPSLHGTAETVTDPAAIGQTAQSLRLTHALETPVPKEPWVKGAKVGEYLLTYADGTEERHALFTGWNISTPQRLFKPNLHKLYRHTGYFADYFCTRCPNGYYAVELPLQNKELSSVTLLPAENVKINWKKTELIR